MLSNQYPTLPISQASGTAILKPQPVFPITPTYIPNSPYNEQSGYPTAPPASSNIAPHYIPPGGIIPGVPTPNTPPIPNSLGSMYGTNNSQGGQSYSPTNPFQNIVPRGTSGQINGNQNSANSQQGFQQFMKMLQNILQPNAYANNQYMQPGSQPAQQLLGPGGTYQGGNLSPQLMQMLSNPAFHQILQQLFMS